MSFDGIYVGDIENTPEQEEFLKNNIEKYWEEHPEEKKSLEDMNISSTPHKNKTLNFDNISNKIVENPTLEDVIKYSDHLGKMLDSSIIYSEYIAENLNKLYTIMLEKNIITLEEMDNLNLYRVTKDSLKKINQK